MAKIKLESTVYHLIKASRDTQQGAKSLGKLPED